MATAIQKLIFGVFMVFFIALFSTSVSAETCSTDSSTWQNAIACRGAEIGSYVQYGGAWMKCYKGSVIGSDGNYWCRAEFEVPPSPPPVSTCPIGSECRNSDSTWQGRCVYYLCPEGNTNGDFGCDEKDAGVWWYFDDCVSGLLASKDWCGQSDQVDDSNKYCDVCEGYVEVNWESDCSNTPRKPQPEEYCGDGSINQDFEQCDAGTNNGKVCEASWGSSCTYCSTDCKIKTVQGPYCGDDTVNPPYEQCDDGSDNGKVCEASWGSSCNYCTNDCKVKTIEGPYCGDDVLNAPYESCDDGSDNGKVCEASWGSSCTYCSTDCKIKTVQGPYCGDDVLNAPYESCDDGSQNGVVCDPGWNGECTYCSDSCRIVLVEGPSCQNECNIEETECSGDALLKCGNFDSDPCTEWGNPQNCGYTDESETYYMCENDDSVAYKVVEEGFCNDRSGHTDYCDSTSTEVKIKETDCGITTCEQDTFCFGDDVYYEETCISRGCDSDTGKCYAGSTGSIDIEDCGEDTTTDDFCQGNDIVFGDVDRGCKETAGGAVCYEDTDFVFIEDCGPDTCVSHTDKDIFVMEHVEDFEGCVENGSPYCSDDPGEVYDFCLNEDILEQVYCAGEDHSFQEFDCNQLDGCFEFDYEQCYNCPDYYGGCYEKNCTRTGVEFRDYQCGSGACNYEMEWIDADNDRIDDRCDDCIDTDRDGICDDVDNCPTVKNANQIDNDKDGIGDACDFDRDGDGYDSEEDCNDWNPDINPGQEEIKDNGIDDDCNPDTSDKGFYSSREAIHIDILTQDESTLRLGDEMVIIVTVTNNGDKTMDHLTVQASLPELMQRREYKEDHVRSGRSETFEFRFYLPEYLESDHTYLRVNVDSSDYKRKIYREIVLPTK